LKGSAHMIIWAMSILYSKSISIPAMAFSTVRMISMWSIRLRGYWFHTVNHAHL
jgi:hypothetical protein